MMPLELSAKQVINRSRYQSEDAPKAKWFPALNNSTWEVDTNSGTTDV